MEIAIGVIIGAGLALLARSTKRHSKDNRHKTKPLQQADEELITTILPTIRNDE